MAFRMEDPLLPHVALVHLLHVKLQHLFLVISNTSSVYKYIRYFRFVKQMYLDKF
jgi:hypothetical protein